MGTQARHERTLHGRWARYVPTVASLTLHRFAERGGLDYRSIDGWGLGFFDGKDLRLYREPDPARYSAWLQFIQTRRIRARLLLSHIRHATR